MELFCSIPFGKKSKIVTRDRGTLDENTQVTEKQQSGPSICTDTEFYEYPAFVVGHAKRNDLTKKSEMMNDNICKTQSRKRLFNLDSPCTPSSCDDLPHPSKLRKPGHSRPAKLIRSLEKQMCVDNHLRQLRQRNYKYQTCKNEEMASQSSNHEPNYSSLQSQKHCLKQNFSYPSLAKSVHGAGVSSLSTPLPKLPQIKKQVKSPVFEPQSILLGSASTEQEEEDRWFHELWKPRNKQKCTEE